MAHVSNPMEGPPTCMPVRRTAWAAFALPGGAPAGWSPRSRLSSPRRGRLRGRSWRPWAVVVFQIARKSIRSRVYASTCTPGDGGRAGSTGDAPRGDRWLARSCPAGLRGNSSARWSTAARVACGRANNSSSRHTAARAACRWSSASASMRSAAEAPGRWDTASAAAWAATFAATSVGRSDFKAAARAATAAAAWDTSSPRQKCHPLPPRLVSACAPPTKQRQNKQEQPRTNKVE